MYAAREREVCFNGITTAEIAFDAGVDLVALWNSQRWIETTRKACIQHTKLTHQIRVSTQRFRKVKVRCDEGASLLRGHHFAGQWIAQEICVEEELRSEERRVGKE